MMFGPWRTGLVLPRTRYSVGLILSCFRARTSASSLPSTLQRRWELLPFSPREGRRRRSRVLIEFLALCVLLPNIRPHDDGIL